MIILDTDTLTLYFAGHLSVTEKVRAAVEVPVTSLVSRIEVLQGRFDSVLFQPELFGVVSPFDTAVI